ncbi:MAG: molecular chaperone TorD family protein [Desulfurivibrio sp.]|nr:molecular chaperone TorD family protein [Desulfurivibrio sp.]
MTGVRNSGDDERQRGRGEAYKALTALFYTPDDALGDILNGLHAALERCFPDLAAYADDLRAEFADPQLTLASLEVDHARLFLGPDTMRAAPYGSLYLEAEGGLMGETTMNALEHYRAVGLKANADLKQPPDFIATELEFMYFLIHCHLESGAEEFLARQMAFIDQHPGLWIGTFCETVDREANTDFYRLLAATTQAFVLSDQEYLGSLRQSES